MGQFILNEGAAPATPASGYTTVYAKTDGLVYSKDDAGAETALSGAALTGSASQTFSVAPATSAAHAVRMDQFQTPTFTGLTTTNGQVKFPATQNASTDANTLDDYEEGTWTPVIGSGITSPTYSLQIGTYTKIGNNVTITGNIETTGGTLNTSHVNISGLPFAAGIESSAVIGRVGGGAARTLSTDALSTLSLQGDSIYMYTTSGGTFIGTSFSSSTLSLYLSASFTI